MPSIRTPLLKESLHYGPYRPPRKDRSGKFLMGTLFLMGLTGFAVFQLTARTMWDEMPGVTRRVAIIGAGASGASAAYFLAKNGPGGPSLDTLEITVFEKASQVGGRCYAVEVPHLAGVGASPMKIEVGAPGYNIKLDTVLSGIIADIDMTENVLPGGRWGDIEGDYELGIYDGYHMLYRQPYDPKSWWYWWTNVEYFMRYGWAHRNLKSIGDQIMPQIVQFKNALQHPGKWSKLLQSPLYTFPQLLKESMAANAWNFMEGKTVKRPFTTEQIQARTRARYGTNLGLLSGLQATKAMQDVENEANTNVAFMGGMANIFAKMLEVSPSGNANVSVLLGTKVLGLRKSDVQSGEEKGWTVAYSHLDQDEPTRGPVMNMEVFDDVIIAGPWKTVTDGMKWQPQEQVPNERWEQVHVTLFTTRSKLEPRAFGLEKGDFRGMPNRILSTLSEGEQGRLGRDSGRAGVGHVGWWTIENVANGIRGGQANMNMDGDGTQANDVQTEYVYKIVSPSKIEDGAVKHYLEWDRKDAPVTWIYRHYWEQAYGTPLPAKVENRVMPLQVDEGLWYTGGFENVAGGVEEAVVMGKRLAEELKASWKVGMRLMRGTNVVGQEKE